MLWLPLYFDVTNATKVTFFFDSTRWYELKPELFIQNPSDFKIKLLTLEQHYYTRFRKQPCET